MISYRRLKQKWNIRSDLDFVLIMVVFSVAGMGIIPARHLIFSLFGYTAQTPLWQKFITWLAFVFPLYQIFLLIFGSLLGQFGFFWDKEKKMIQWIRRKIGMC